MVGSNTSKQREKKRQKAFVNGRDKRRRRGKVGRKTKNYSLQVARGLIKRVHGWHGRRMEIVFSSHSKDAIFNGFLLAMMMMMMIDGLFYSQLLFSPYSYCTVCYRVNELAMIELMLVCICNMEYSTL